MIPPTEYRALSYARGELPPQHPTEGAAVGGFPPLIILCVLLWVVRARRQLR